MGSWRAQARSSPGCRCSLSSKALQAGNLSWLLLLPVTAPISNALVLLGDGACGRRPRGPVTAQLSGGLAESAEEEGRPAHAGVWPSPGTRTLLAWKRTPFLSGSLKGSDYCKVNQREAFLPHVLYVKHRALAFRTANLGSTGTFRRPERRNDPDPGWGGWGGVVRAGLCRCRVRGRAREKGAFFGVDFRQFYKLCIFVLK